MDVETATASAVPALLEAGLYRPSALAADRTLLPAQHGIYSWWSDAESGLDLPGQPHPAAPELKLLYVGIAGKPSSSLRQRILTHIAKTSRRSTLRLSLASLLAPTLGWTAAVVSGRAALDPEFEPALNDWMDEHLRVSWLTHDAPGCIEHAVIAQLGPPLNLDGNSAHPQYAAVRSARAAFRADADFTGGP
jgi:hypothetical protein